MGQQRVDISILFVPKVCFKIFMRSVVIVDLDISCMVWLAGLVRPAFCWFLKIPIICLHFYNFPYNAKLDNEQIYKYI